jgi:PAB-dependent poly(A)-specific ribonuclease subunit 2
MSGSTSYKPIAPISSANTDQPVAALAFDPASDTLWAGSSTGDISSYHGVGGIRGVSFPVGGKLGVKKIVPGESYVRALGIEGEGLGQWTKGGMNKWYLRFVQRYSQNHLVFTTSSIQSFFNYLQLLKHLKHSSNCGFYL